MQNELPPDRTKYPQKLEVRGPKDPELRRLWKLQLYAVHYGISEKRMAEIDEAYDRRLRTIRMRRWILAVTWALTIAGILWFAYAVATGA